MDEMAREQIVRREQLSGNEVACKKGPGVGRQQNTAQVLAVGLIFGEQSITQ